MSDKVESRADRPKEPNGTWSILIQAMKIK